MKYTIAHITLGEISLVIATLFSKIEVSDTVQVFLYAAVAGVGGLVPKIIWEWFRDKTPKSKRPE